MPAELRVLIVEDSADDAELIVFAIKEGGYEVVSEVVATEAAYVTALAVAPWDVILCDHNLPLFNSFKALRLLQTQGQDIPFIIVSGAIGEETAVAAMKAGASDYVMKDRLARLVPAIEREIREAAVRRDRARAQEALQQSEERFRLATSAGRVGVWDWDVVANIATWSDTVYSIHGLEPGTFGGTIEAFAELVHVDDREYVNEAIQRALYQDMPYELEFRAVRPDGEIVWIFTQARVMRDASGRVVRMAGSETDITERKEAEEALLEANRQKDEFLAMLSHELRNPLAPIANAIHLLRLGRGDTSIQQEALSALERQVGALTRIVDDLLDVSRVTRRRIHLKQADVDLNTLVQSVADSFRPQMAERQHQFSVSLSNAPLWVHGDPIRLEQVVVNLLSNAAKYTPKGGRVWLRVMVDRGEALIRVKDSGMGIEAGLLPHIFELFIQGESTLDRAQGGLGIGLPLVKSLVEMHGGSVTAESKGTGKGSEFSVRLPTVPSPASQAETPPDESGEVAARSLRVLLVDDVEDTRKLFGRLLEILGNQVRIAHDGPGALEMALEFSPDVVFLDIGLPGISGYEVALRMRQEPGLQNAVLVAVTGYGQQSDRQRSQAAGFDHHLVKPLDIDALRQLLAAIAETRTS